MSFATPTKKLSIERPASKVFCVPVIVSIASQFSIHMAALVYSIQLGTPYMDLNDPSLHPDGAFTPSVINSIVFLVSTLLQLNTFVVNYKGRPFMYSLHENKAFFRAVLTAYALVIAALFEVFTPLNVALEMVPFPSFTVRFYVARQTLIFFNGFDIYRSSVKLV